MKKIKKENQILIMLAFFSISVGLWGNFRQLWLQDNKFSVTNISNILSIGTLISVIIIGLIGKDKIKNMLVIVLLVKVINVFLLYFLNMTGYTELIKLSIIIDIVTEYIVITSIYPLITTIIKTGTIYSKRRLTEYLFRDVGILFGGMLIGKNIAKIFINYNSCLFISNIFLIFSLFMLLMIKVNDYKCYSINGFLSPYNLLGEHKNEYDIEKETGLVRKAILDEHVVTREYEFENVDDSVFVEPDISQYTLKEND